ncbi:retrovirus-related pol polyprotein from transposon TNT 1-94 [Tanacetum coccineum]
MASSITRFDIEKFDGKNDFGLWQIKMRALMVQQGCDAALETLPVDMEACEKAALMKKAYSILILCLGDRVLREVTKETTAAGIWTKLTSLYMTKSLANRPYLKKKLYTYYMSPGMKLGDHIDEFNKLILELANIFIEIELMRIGNYSYLHRLPSALKKRTEGTKEDNGDGLYVRGRSDHSGKDHSSGSLRFKSRGGTGKLKCFICHSEGRLKRECPKKKSSGFVKKGKRDQNLILSLGVFFGNKGNAYFGEALAVVRNDEMTDLTCTIKGTGKVKIQLHDGSSFILEDVKYVPGLRRSLISLGTLCGKKRGAQGDREVEVFQVSNNDTAVAQRRLEDKQLEEKVITRTALIKGAEKLHLGIKGVGTIITVTGVQSQEGIVAEKKVM